MKIIIELQSSCFEAILCSQMFKGHNPSFKKQKKCEAFLKGVAILKRVGITGNILEKQGLYVVRTKMDIF